MRLVYILAAVLSLILPSYPAHSQPATPTPTPYFPADFDGDGLTDLGAFDDEADGSANTLVYDIELSNGGSLSNQFGKTGDIPAHGDYDGDGKWDLAIARELSEENVIRWRVRDTETGTKTTLYDFGNPDDTVVAGCDFDQDGITDAAVVRANVLYIRQSSDSQMATVNLALEENVVFAALSCFDFDGDGALELLGLTSITVETPEEDLQQQKQRCRKRRRKFGKGHTRVRRCRKKLKRLKQGTTASAMSSISSDGQTVSTTELEEQALGVIAADIDNDGTDEVAYYTDIGNSQYRIHFVDGDSDPITFDVPAFVGLTVAKLDSGNESPVDSIVIYSFDSTFYRLSIPSMNISAIEVNVEGEELVQANNIGYTGATRPDDPNGLCDEYQPAHDGPGWGFLFKLSDHGGTVNLLPGQYQTPMVSVELRYNGDLIDKFFYTGFANPDLNPALGRPLGRQHWRSHHSPTSFPDGSVLVATERGGNVVCWELGEMSNRID